VTAVYSESENRSLYQITHAADRIWKFVNEALLCGPLYWESTLPNAGEVQRRGDYLKGGEHESREG